MKKFESTTQCKVSDANFNQKSNKLDLISLIPQIMQILPNLTTIFGKNNTQNQEQIYQQPPQLTPPQFQHKENQKAVITAMESHKKRINQIKNEKTG